MRSLITKILVLAALLVVLTQAGTIASHGCERAQGFLISRPMPAEAFGEWVARYAAVDGNGDRAAGLPALRAG